MKQILPAFRLFSSSSSVVRVNELLCLKPKEKFMIPRVRPFESFEEIPGIDAGLLERFKAVNLNKPTALQGSLLYHFFTSKRADLLVRGCPGAGKSIGYLMALMTRAGMREGEGLSGVLNVPDRTKHLILVPTEQLALQLREAVECFSVSSSPVSSSPSRSILITQPDSVAVSLAQGNFDWRGLETVVLDEADALIKPLKRYATANQKRARAQHPVPTIQLLSQLWSLFHSDPLRRDLRPRLIVCSATLNKATKHDLTVSGVLHEGGRACISIDLPGKEGGSVKPHYKHLLLSDPESVPELIAKLAVPLGKLKSGGSGSGSGKSDVAMILLPAEQSKIGLISLLRQHFPSLRFGLLSEGGKGVDVFVGSDVDVRGLNVPHLQQVIILDLPRTADHFTHMAGRVGRGFNPDGTVWTVLGTAKDYEKYTAMMAQLGHLSLPVLE